jgi:2-C-methyl-D-erythritol 4-phosphate cytidylyltransferase
MNYLIIVAGGNGERMKSKGNKIFLKIRNKEIIYWTLKVFEKSPIIDAIVVSAKISDQEKIKNIISKNHIKKVIGIVNGGKVRQETVENSLNWLKTKAKRKDLIGIHNAANPFVLQQEIKDVFRAAKVNRAALLARKASDTVKITNGNNLVSHTPIRESCWYAQTPQAALYGDLVRAFDTAKNKKFIGTDDAQLLEMIGIRAKIVPCSTNNLKITFPTDLILAKKILPIFIKENK